MEGLQKQLADAQQEQKDLNDQADLTRKRLARASKLTTALGDEGVRWQTSADKLATDVGLLVGDVFISAACIAYCGAFTGPYRQGLLGQWVAQCSELGIPTTDGVTLRGCLASAVEVRPCERGGGADSHSGPGPPFPSARKRQSHSTDQLGQPFTLASTCRDACGMMSQCGSSTLPCMRVSVCTSGEHQRVQVCRYIGSR